MFVTVWVALFGVQVFTALDEFIPVGKIYHSFSKYREL